MTRTDSHIAAPVVPFPHLPQIDLYELATSLCSITDALKCWQTWTGDVPPGGPMLGPVCDKLLADEFRQLLAIDGANARLSYLEDVIHSFEYARRNSQRVDKFIGVLIVWWMEIHKGWAPTIGADEIDTFIERYCRTRGYRFDAQVLETLAVPFQVGHAWTAETAAEVIDELIEIHGLRR